MQFLHVQAFIIAGGFGLGDTLSGVVTLLRGATVWTSLTSLPRRLGVARSSIVAGKMRLIGGFDGSSYRSEVSIWKQIYIRVWLKRWAKGLFIIGVGDLSWKFIFSLNRAWKWFNSKFNSKQNPKYSFKKYSFNWVREIQYDYLFKRLWG